MSRMFSGWKRRVISFVTGLCVLGTTALAPVGAAFAQSVCSSAADFGQVPSCAAVRIGGIAYGYPKVQWTPIASLGTPPVQGSGSVISGDQTIVLANRAARALGLSADQVANAVQTYPANAPIVVARYNPADAVLKIDMFRLDRSSAGVTLNHATFGPSNGDAWKAARAYIDPGSRAAGVSPGVNPFAAFTDPSDPTKFVNISIAGAQVAVGHAMRSVGSAVGLMSVVNTSFSQVRKESGGWFRKTIEVWTYGHASPVWYMAMPVDMARSSSFGMPAICASAPNQTSCPLYATATAGVVFEQFQGGTLSGAENVWQVDYQSSSGWTFLAFVGLALLVGIDVASIMKVAGLLDGPGSIGGAQVGLAPAVGDTGTSVAANQVLGGAAYGAGAQANPSVMYQQVATVDGTAYPPSLTTLQGRLNGYVSPMNTNDFVADNNAGNNGSPTMAGFSQTVYGNCAPNRYLSTCGGSSGFTPRADQFQETNQVTFMRDNSGNVLRDVSGQ